MSKWVVDIHGEIEGDYEIIKKYEEDKIVVTPNDDVDVSVLFGECKDNYKEVILTDSFGRSVKALYDKSREILIFSYITTEFAKTIGYTWKEESDA